jgi:ArsR family transcriptional regulator
VTTDTKPDVDQPMTVETVDLNAHTFEQARELYADVWLGFAEGTLHGFLKQAGFQKVEVSLAAREEAEPGFETLLASGVRPEGPAA